jgi:hypothetical protein
VSSTRHAVVRYVVWNGGKWYVKEQLRARREALRRRLPSRRASLLAAVGALSALAATAVLARRLSG